MAEPFTVLPEGAPVPLSSAMVESLRRRLEEIGQRQAEAERHYGPDDHPSGSPQKVHGGGDSAVELPEHIRESEDYIRGLRPDIEMGAVTDASGKPINGVFKGEEDGISFPDGVLEQAEGGYLTHFHPSTNEGRPAMLSQGDVMCHIDAGMGATRCFGINGDWAEVSGRPLPRYRGEDGLTPSIHFWGRFLTAWTPQEDRLARRFGASHGRASKDAWQAEYERRWFSAYERTLRKVCGEIGLTIRTGKTGE